MKVHTPKGAIGEKSLIIGVRVPLAMREAIESWVGDYNYIHQDNLSLSDFVRLSAFKILNELDPTQELGQ